MIPNLTDLLSDIAEIVTKVMSWITGNPVLNFIFCAGLISIGFYVVRKAKRVAKA